MKAVTGFDRAFDRAGGGNYLVINLGSGNGVTVRELVTAFEKVWGGEIRKEDAPSRPGDVAGAYASADRALKLLDWKTGLDIEDGISSSLQWGRKRESILSW